MWISILRNLGGSFPSNLSFSISSYLRQAQEKNKFPGYLFSLVCCLGFFGGRFFEKAGSLKLCRNIAFLLVFHCLSEIHGRYSLNIQCHIIKICSYMSQIGLLKISEYFWRPLFLSNPVENGNMHGFYDQIYDPVIKIISPPEWAGVETNQYLKYSKF